MAFDSKSFYNLFVFILCMGFVCFPYKTDNCNYDNICPYHTIIHETGMSQDHFVFLWRNFIISSLDLLYKYNKHDDSYIGGNKYLEENQLSWDPIDIQQHQSQNV